MRSVLFALLAVTMFAATATAQPYYARGEFNGWGLDDPMTQIDSVLWTATVSGLDPFTLFDYKIANEDWSINAPGSNGRVQPNANGDITFLFHVPPRSKYTPGRRRRGLDRLHLPRRNRHLGVPLGVV